MRLMVSHDCGGSYFEKATGTLEELTEQAKELKLDEQLLRWVIESNDGQEQIEVSAIHKEIISFMTRARATE